jgi:hypothetical protein
MTMIKTPKRMSIFPKAPKPNIYKPPKNVTRDRAYALKRFGAQACLVSVILIFYFPPSTFHLPLSS